jgi:hypothetical protein
VYVARGVPVNQDGLKLNDAHQLLIYADNVNTLGSSVQTVRKKTENLRGACKETGIEGNAGKNKEAAKPRDQNAVPSHNIKSKNEFLKGGRVQTIGHDGRKSKLYSGRN